MTDAHIWAEAVLDERKAICRMLAFQAARAGYRGLKAPWWDIRSQLRMRWTIAVLTGTIHHIEQGEHHDRQAEWMTDIETDEFLDRGVASFIAKHDGSPAHD